MSRLTSFVLHFIVRFFFFFALKRWGIGIGIDFVGLAQCHPIMSWMYVYIYFYDQNTLLVPWSVQKIRLAE